MAGRFVAALWILRRCAVDASWMRRTKSVLVSCYTFRSLKWSFTHAYIGWCWKRTCEWIIAILVIDFIFREERILYCIISELQ